VDNHNSREPLPGLSSFNHLLLEFGDDFWYPVCMGDRESWHHVDPHEFQGGEILSGRHFYAAYVFDQAESRQADVQAVLQHATRLGYPVRYWWLSAVMDLQGSPDRLIVCVHHPSSSEDAGMDLYETLRAAQVEWDDLDVATLEEFIGFGRPVDEISKFALPGGISLFPEAK
jgi:hypothetical protein